MLLYRLNVVAVLVVIVGCYGIQTFITEVTEVSKITSSELQTLYLVAQVRDLEMKL